MLNVSLAAEARMIVEDFVRVTPTERVLLVTDYPRRREVEALAAAVDAVGASYLVVDATQMVRRLQLADRFWLPPDPALVSAMQSSTVSIFTVDETYAFRLDHQIRHLLETSEQCSVYKVDLGMGTWNLTQRDIELATDVGRRLMEAVDGHDEVRVTSKRGTDIILSIAGRPCLPVVPVPTRGHPFGISVPLWSEYNWAPIEPSTNGIVIVDGITEASAELHAVESPIEMVIRDGRAHTIRGGRDARELENALSADPGAAVVGELGMGANHKARAGTETEKALLGTIHLGFGDNGSYPGGVNRSGVHIDVGVRDVSIEVDGVTVMRDGLLVSTT